MSSLQELPDGPMSATVELRLDGPMDHLRLAWQAGETLLASVPFEQEAESQRYNILLSVQELLTNILRHGYEGDESQPVEISMMASEDGFVFELRDRGLPFDPLSHEEAPVSGEGSELQIGGYGIVIVKMVMDQLSYRYEGGWNILRAEKSTHAKVALEVLGEQT